MAVTINNAEIRNLQVGPTIITDGLVSFWTAASRLSYPRTGSIWYDMIIANRNNGSLINMSGTNFTEDAQGALVFDGTDEYMSVPSDSSLNFDNGDVDELYAKAVDIVVNQQKVDRLYRYGALKHHQKFLLLNHHPDLLLSIDILNHCQYHRFQNNFPDLDYNMHSHMLQE